MLSLRKGIIFAERKHDNINSEILRYMQNATQQEVTKIKRKNPTNDMSEQRIN